VPALFFVITGLKLKAPMSGSEERETARAVSPGNNAHVEQGVMNIGGHVDIGTIHINSELKLT
jgi:hypothetical protein